MDDATFLDRIRRFLSDPVRVQRPLAIVGIILAIVSGLSFALLATDTQAFALGISWLALIPVSLLLGWSKAFFIEFGRGARRAILEMVGGALTALTACVLLTLDSSGAAGTVVQFLAGFALFYALFRSLSAAVGLGVGRGAGYLGRRIQNIDDDGW